MKEILVVVFFFNLQKAFHTVEHESLNIMVYVVFLKNGLNLISQIENNMSQLMVMILILLM